MPPHPHIVYLCEVKGQLFRGQFPFPTTRIPGIEHPGHQARWWVLLPTELAILLLWNH